MIEGGLPAVMESIQTLSAVGETLDGVQTTDDTT